MPDEQTELFGEVGGLFGPDTIATTPIDQLDLPRETPTGAPVTARGETVAQLRARLTEQTSPGGLFEPGPAEEPEPVAEILGPCQTCGGPVTRDDGARTRWGLLHDGCNEPDDGPAWTVDNPPTLHDLASGLAPWLVSAVLEAQSDTEAADTLRHTLANSGRGDSRGHITGTQRGYVLGMDDGPLLARWRDLAEAVRSCGRELPDHAADLAAACLTVHRCDVEAADDPAPFLPASCTDTERRRVHMIDTRKHETRRRARDNRRAPAALEARELVAEILARMDEPSAGALF